MSGVHNTAESGFGTGTNELYDRARPSYQPYALAHILSHTPQGKLLNIVEIGAGTGIFTRALLTHPNWQNSIGHLEAIEPSKGMRDVFEKTIQDERVSCKEGTFDSTGVDNDSADIVIIAQAFHWCPDFESAAVEFARILKPGGVVALIWNLEDRDAAAWVLDLRDTIEAYEDGAPQFRTGKWRQIYDAPSFGKMFNPAVEKSWSYDLETSVDATIERAASKSYIAVLDTEEKNKVLERVKAIVEKGEGKIWIDQSRGTFQYPYQTLVSAFIKK